MTKPSKPEEKEEHLPGPEEVLRKMLNTPPDPFTPQKTEKKPKK